ncbi:MAG: hypothetical protein NZV14_03690 [Bryobacteraceae bacterium]|nr:hypothetical protein [Bryobacteraceae bacterium]MDW8377239.1 hypothetical protein [Bryobacterales bacterium]
MLSLFRCVLTFRERMQLAWRLVWPAVVLDVIWSTVVYQIYGTIPPKAELLFVIFYLILIAPWLVRRMMRGRYAGFRLLTLVDGKEAPMGYTESFKVMWLLSWRTSVCMLLALFLLSLFGRFLSVQLSSLVPTAEEAPLFNAIGLSLLENGAALVLLPLVMPGMFHKQYQGFRVAAQRL